MFFFFFQPSLLPAPPSLLLRPSRGGPFPSPCPRPAHPREGAASRLQPLSKTPALRGRPSSCLRQPGAPPPPPPAASRLQPFAQKHPPWDGSGKPLLGRKAVRFRVGSRRSFWLKEGGRGCTQGGLGRKSGHVALAFEAADLVCLCGPVRCFWRVYRAGVFFARFFNVCFLLKMYLRKEENVQSCIKLPLFRFLWETRE